MVRDHSPLGDEGGGFPVQPAAEREGGVADGDARVSREDGPQAQGLVEDVAQVLQVFELRVVWRRAGEGRDLGAQFGPDVRAPCELVPDVAEEAGGGVAAGEENVE